MSLANQKVLVSASTWQERSYPLECDPSGENFHVLEVEGVDFGWFDSGTYMIEPFEMTTGQ